MANYSVYRPPCAYTSLTKGASDKADRSLHRRRRRHEVLAWPQHPGLIQEGDQQIQDSRELFLVAREQKPAVHPRRRLRLLTLLHFARMKRKLQEAFVVRVFQEPRTPVHV